MLQAATEASPQPDLDPRRREVAGGAARDQQRGQHQGVDVDDPLHLGGVATRSERIAGMATLTVASIETISRLRQQEVRMTLFRRGLSSSTTLVITQILLTHN